MCGDGTYIIPIEKRFWKAKRLQIWLELRRVYFRILAKPKWCIANRKTGRQKTEKTEEEVEEEEEEEEG